MIPFTTNSIREPSSDPASERALAELGQILDLPPSVLQYDGRFGSPGRLAPFAAAARCSHQEMALRAAPADGVGVLCLLDRASATDAPLCFEAAGKLGPSRWSAFGETPSAAHARLFERVPHAESASYARTTARPS